MGRASREKRDRRSGSPPVEPRTWHYGYFLVAYIDLLGQRDQLMKLTQLPHTLEAKEPALAILRESAGKVRAIRDAFKSYLATVSENRQPLIGVPPELRREFLGIRTLEFRQVGFSDTFVIAVPLRETEHGPARGALGVWSALYGLAGMMLTSMSIGIPLRAGIDIERAIDIFPGEAYGPALINAYRLESQIAKYPRAVIGRGVLDYVGYLESLSVTTRSAATAKALSVQIRDLICSAPDDQRPMLHFLSKRILDLGSAFTEPASKAYLWAREERQTHGASGNTELEDRYTRLLQYFEANGFKGASAVGRLGDE